MLDTLVKATILLALVACAAYLLRHRSAAVRHLLWALSIAGLIALPLLTTLVPFRLPILPSLSTSTTNTPREREARPSNENAAASRRPADPVSEPLQAEISPNLSPVDGATRDGGIPQIDLRRALILAWLVVAAILVTRFIVGLVTVHRIAKRAVVIDDESWHSLADRAGGALDLKVPVDLRRSDDVAMPFASGLLRPVIVLPSASREWSAERLTAVLMHELAHISRGDLAMNILSHVVRAVYWFHPLAWLAAYRLRVEGERSCDDAVLRAGALPSDYADHLLSIVRTEGNTVPTVALAMARRSDFEGRLLAILEPGVPRGTITRSRAAGVAALFFALVMPLAALTPAAAAAIAAPMHPQADSQAARPSQGTESAQSAAAVAALMETLRDESPSVRLAAVASLGSLGDPRAIAALAKALHEDTDARVREAAARALGEIDDKRAVLPLLEALKVERVANVREHIVRALAEINDRSAVAGISAVIKDPSVSVRRAAVSALGELGDASSVPALLTMVRDEDVEVRRNVAGALGHLENPSAIDPLIAMARDSDVEVRTNALESLAHFEDERALPAFLAALKDTNAEVRQHGAEGIGNLHEKLKSAPRPLIDALNDPNAQVRHTAADALGNVGDEAAVPALKKLTSDSNTEVRHAAAEALSEIGGPDAIQALMGLLKDSDPEIRKIAAEALGRKRRD